MAFCGACGAEVAGQRSARSVERRRVAVAAPAAAAAPPTAGMEENVAGLLCLSCGMDYRLDFLADRQAPVCEVSCGAVDRVQHRVHSRSGSCSGFAASVIAMITAAIHIPIGFLMFFLSPIIGLAFLVLWIFLMYKAYNHEKYKLPIIGNLVEGMVK